MGVGVWITESPWYSITPVHEYRIFLFVMKNNFFLCCVSVIYKWIHSYKHPHAKSECRVFQCAGSTSLRTSTCSTGSVRMTRGWGQFQTTPRRRSVRRSYRIPWSRWPRSAPTPWWGWFSANCECTTLNTADFLFDTST